VATVNTDPGGQCGTADCYTTGNCNSSGACSAVAANTSATVGGGVVYCDNADVLWTPTAILGGAATVYQWTLAVAYCDNLTYAGNSDWLAAGMYQLLNFWITPCGSAACGSGNPGVSWDTNAKASLYWTNEGWGAYEARCVFFSEGTGFYSNCDRLDQNYVRCTR
jgi:hypothetical protein